MPVRRHRRRSLEARLRSLWRGGYVATDSGDLAFLPAPLEFQAMRILFGGFEAHPAALKFLPPGGTALDIGANLGEWTVPLARAVGTTGRVIAVEPNPAIAAALSRTLAINNLTQTQVLDLAVSDRRGSAELVLNPASSGESRLGTSTESRSSVTVQTHRLDDLVAKHGVNRLDLVKIDVEGHERQVLEGATATLRRFRPAVVIESGHETGDDRRTVASLFKALEYELVAVLHDHGALPASLEDYLAIQGACSGREAHNLLLLPGRA
jgi:FkbM family methyltransferase